MNRLISQKLIDKINKLFTSLWTDASGNVGIDGNLQVNGNQTETGNLIVDGYIKQGKFELDQDIPITFCSAYSTALSIKYSSSPSSQ